MNTGGTCTPPSVNYSQDNFDRYRVYTGLATGVDDHPGIHAFTPYVRRSVRRHGLHVLLHFKNEQRSRDAAAKKELIQVE